MVDYWNLGVSGELLRNHTKLADFIKCTSARKIAHGEAVLFEAPLTNGNQYISFSAMCDEIGA